MTTVNQIWQLDLIRSALKNTPIIEGFVSKMDIRAFSKGSEGIITVCRTKVLNAPVLMIGNYLVVPLKNNH